MMVTDELIELRGLRFHYRDWAGRTPGLPTLVLLHGYTGHSRSWDTFAAAMTDRYRVLAFDQRGHGESAWTDPAYYGTDDMADDLRAFVQALALNSFVLLGLSMGGMVSIRYAGARPPELSRLVIVDIAPKIEALGMLRIQTGVRAPDVFKSKEDAVNASLRANPRAPQSEVRHRVLHNLLQISDGQWTWRYDRALRDPKVPRVRMPEVVGWESAANISVPTLVVRGADSDILSPEIAERLCGTIKGAARVEVAQAGHSIPLDNPQGFLQAVRGFL